MNNFYNPYFANLLNDEKEMLIRDVVNSLSQKFTFQRMEKFSAFDQTTFTAVFDFQGNEFVFVPGNNKLILGWDGFVDGIDNTTREDFENLFAEYEIESSVEDFIKTYMSPVREAKVKPLLVERIPHEIGWKDISFEEVITRTEGRIDEYIESVISGKSKEYQIIKGNNILRIKNINNSVHTSFYDELSYDNFLKSLNEDGFDLASEDEWEYLCGGGARTLWKWGDSIDYSMSFRHFGDNREYDTDKPNCFGLKIAFDPYKYEVIAHSKYLLKAGDGGCNICGGGGIAFGYLPTATFYRDSNVELDNECCRDYLESIGGEYTNARRIVRLGI